MLNSLVDADCLPAVNKLDVSVDGAFPPTFFVMVVRIGWSLNHRVFMNDFESLVGRRILCSSLEAHTAYDERSTT